MRATTIDLPRPIKSVLDAALLRTPVEDRGQLFDFVMRRIEKLDRPITVARMHSAIGAARHALRQTPR